jgi:chemotaxis protein CheZ
MESQTKTGSGNPELYQRLGGITRQLHDALQELGHADKLQGTMGQLPDAKSRLNYIARLTGEAAEKVLNHVDAAKDEQALVMERAGQIQQTIKGVPGLAAAMPELVEWSQNVLDNSRRSDERLTEIMMAQDFHDLTGQVIARVVQLAATIEEQLMELLLQSAPSVQSVPDLAQGLQGPVVESVGRTDVVNDQAGVDDLLASLGF